jgi:hypothetical protein
MSRLGALHFNLAILKTNTHAKALPDCRWQIVQWAAKQSRILRTTLARFAESVRGRAWRGPVESSGNRKVIYLVTYTAGARRNTTGGGGPMSRCQTLPSSNWMRMPSGE